MTPELAATVPVFDSHFHIIDRRFPLVENQGFLPDDFTCRDYLQRTAGVNLAGGAIVSGSFQALDQSYLEDALATLGTDFVGVTQLPVGVSDDEVLRLNGLGVRAVRFNIKRGGSEGIEHLDRMARRVHELAGWHVELYVDSRELPGLAPMLVGLPAVSIDHLGLSATGLPALLSLVERGVRVKATGFGRVDFDVAGALRDICRANPNALMFGTDLPSTRAPRPYRDDDLRLILDTLDLDLARKVLCRNAIEFYRPASSHTLD
ncbi:amidohydrolase family protein [Geomonas sp. Red69]|uniref:Amidohydrolase family protein n=1 Tax=Geomonas diazotrophica TaxID=2843197 RepID=A0ABX8JIN3_9BACT|nr:MULTISPECIES: amidohydrolase family protein [Geomonas]MBU5635608.1 amidohydrolase family protein [Geomonas diazotrophica]QWV98148.1 amidohydrolase family protein [Geomonas nitrogeniifigens]QXE87279.1 amidohydrolase family protein [Geomonas nitrogeniifigens]